MDAFAHPIHAHDWLGKKSYITSNEADSICQNYPSYVWIKDEKSTFQNANEQWVHFLQLSNLSTLTGLNDMDFFIAGKGHSPYDFRLEDFCVMKGRKHIKKLELVTHINRPLASVMVSKIGIISSTSHKVIGTLGIGQPHQINEELFNSDISLAPLLSSCSQTPYSNLTDTEFSIFFMRCIRGLTPAEIAGMRNRKIKTIYNQLTKISHILGEDYTNFLKDRR